MHNLPHHRHALLYTRAPDFQTDFTTGTYPFTPSVNAYSRTSNATLTDSSGKITYAGNNQLTYSSDFSNAAWLTFGSASKVGAAGVADPFGGSTAYELDTGTGNATFDAAGAVYQGSLTVSAGANYIFSIWLRSKTGTVTVRIGFLTSGASTNSGDITLTTTWQQFYVAATNASAATANVSIRGPAAATNNVRLYAAAPQFEAVTYQTTPSFYKPTTSAAYYESPRTLWVNGVASGNLLEGAATNNLLYANKFDTVPWGAGGTPTLTANAGTSPDGTNNAWQISRTSGTAGVYQFSTTSASTTYTSSIYVKISAVSAGAKMRIGNDTGLQYSDFDLNALTVANIGTSVGSVQTAPNGWYRFSITYQPGAGSTGLVFYIVNGNATLLIYGAQQELGVVATTLIPTYSASLTRAADTPSAVSSPLGANLSYSASSNRTIFDATGALTYAPNNLLTYSSWIGGTNWTTQANALNSQYAAVAPDGTTTATKAVISSTAGANAVYQTYTAISGVTYIASVYAKPTGSRYLYIQNNRGDGTFALVQADLNNGTVAYSTNVVTATVTADRNGYYRVSMVYATTGATGSMAFVGSNTVVASSNPSVSGNGVDGVYLWGGQLEAVTYQTTPSAYNATLASAYYGPALDYNASGVAQGLRIEEARTNSIANSTMQGAIAATPGTLPTGWTSDNALPTGLTKSIAAVGMEFGMQYIDISITGTPTAGGYEAFTYGGRIATVAGDVWSGSCYYRLISGSWANISSPAQTTRVENGSFASISDQTTSLSTIGSSLVRVANPANTAPATAALVRTFIVLNFTNGQAVNIRLRIYATQLEKGAFATSFIPTYGSALTRAADDARVMASGLSAGIPQSASVVFEFVQEGLMSSGSFPWVLSVNDNTTNNEIGVYQTGGTTNFNLKERTSASNQFDNTYYTSVAANTTYRLALKWTPSLVTAYMNGGNRASYAGTPPASASLTQIELLSELSSSGRSSGYVRGVSFYNQALSDAQMAVKSVVGSPL